jgi:hypothetical protein
MPSMVGDERYLRWLNRYERQSATPADVRAMIAMDMDIDVRAVLETVRVPTLVIHRRGDRVRAPWRGPCGDRGEHRCANAKRALLAPHELGA